MIRTVCVYCSSSDRIDHVYFAAARELGRVLALRGYTLIYGGGKVGLMGELARSVHEHGGLVCGVIPHALEQKEGVAYDVADEMIITETMQERKAIMFTRADAFLVLPGGFGTLEEFLEVLTLRQLGYHDKRIVLVNTNNFFAPLVHLFDHIVAQHFAREAVRRQYHFAADVPAAMAYLERERDA